MLPAEKKKSERITEYIIHLYQTELLIRNFEFDLEKIKVHVIDNIPDGKTNKTKWVGWYQKVIADMVSELITASEGLVTDPVQACLNGIFGLLPARINGKTISDKQQNRANHFGNVLSYLGYAYHQPSC